MEKMIYFDNAATTFPKPKEVFKFMLDFYSTHGVNPGRSGYDLSIETEDVVFETRKLLSSFFGGKNPDRLTFGYNATDGLNLLLSGYLDDGDHAITTCVEHNSVLRPLYHLSMDRKVDVTYLPFDQNGYVDPDDIKKAINKKTKLVIVNHGSNVIGTLQPIKEIGRICKEKGVTFAIDASQTAGVVPINMETMEFDVVAFTGHKSLLGPTGIGGLCVGEDIVIKHSRYGGTGVKSAVKTHLDEYPFRLETGTLNLIGVAGLNAGIKFVLKEGLDKIYKHEMDLHNKLVDGLKKIDKLTVYRKDKSENHIPVVSTKFSHILPSDVGTILDVEYSIATRTGLQCAPLVHEGIGTTPKGTVRFSIGYFNTDEEVDLVLNAVKVISEMNIKSVN